MQMRLAAFAILACAAPAGGFAQAFCPAAINAQACSSCHGDDEQSSIPRLIEMERESFIAAMEAFKNGERESTIMGRLAPAYSTEDIEALADYFAAGGQCQ